MAVIGTAEYILKATGLRQVLDAASRFRKGVTTAMETSGKATEKTTKVTRKSIIGYAALGAAIGVVFTDFIRKSSVMSTMISTWGTLFGATADIILIQLMPAFTALTDALVDFMEAVDAMPDSMKVLAGAFGLLGIALVGVSIITVPVAAALGLVAGAIALVVNEWENQQRAFEVGGPWWDRQAERLRVMWDRLTDLTTALYETSTAFAFGITVALANAGEAIRDFFVALPLAIIEEVSSGFPKLTELGGDIVNAIAGGFEFTLGLWGDVLKGVADWIRDLVTGGFPTLVTLGADMFGAILQGFQDALEGAGGFFSDVADAIVGFFTGSPQLHPRIAGEFSRIGSEMTQAIKAGMAGGVPAGGTATVAVTVPPAVSGVGGASINLIMYQTFEVGAGGIPGLPDFNTDEAFRRRFREAGEEVGEGILTTLHRRRL